MTDTKTQTTILNREDCIKRLDSFIEHNDVGTIFPENFFTSLRHHIDLGHPDINSLAAERDDLLRWKSEAMQVMKDLDLQAIAKEMDLKLGGNIASEILPYIRKLKGNAP